MRLAFGNYVVNKAHREAEFQKTTQMIYLVNTEENTKN